GRRRRDSPCARKVTMMKNMKLQRLPGQLKIQNSKLKIGEARPECETKGACFSQRRRMMETLSPTKLESLANAFTKARIAVIGDLMLDRYLFGTVSRFSPEAPVPILDIPRDEWRLGGAA